MDNTPLYVTGAVICELAFKIKGVSGIKEMYTDRQDDIYSVLEKHLSIPRKKIDAKVIEEIKKYAY